MSEHLPALLVVVPLLGAPICLLLRQRLLANTISIGIAWATALVALGLILRVMEEGSVVYALGGWAAPFGIEYRVDLLNAFVACVVSIVGAIVLPIGPGINGHSVSASREYLYDAAFLLCLAGLLGVTITGDVFNVFVFLEISSLAAYTLVALGNQRRALRAAFSYLVMGTIGGTFFLIGVGFLYQMTGTLNMADLARLLPDVLGNRAVHAAFAFMLVGIGIKLAVFPLHQWLPNAYTYAPPAVSAFLAATATKVAYYLLVRLCFTIFGAGFVFSVLGLRPVLQVFSLVAMFVGALAAINQTDLKRLLAYSSVSQIGYMTLGLSFGTVTGLTGGLAHIANHALMKGGLFLVVACVVARTGSSVIADMRGLGRRMPWTMAAFTAGGLGLIGVPLTAGFVSKWFLVLAAIEADQMVLAFAILVSSLLAAAYVWRVVEVVWFQEPLQSAPDEEAPLRLLLPTWILIGASLYFGVATDWTAGTAARAAGQLLGVSP